MYLLLRASQRLKQNQEDVLLHAHLQELYLSVKDLGLMSKRRSTPLRHGDLPREEDGAIEFWRLKDCLRYEFENSRHRSDETWKSRMAGDGGNKKIFQYCTDPSGQEILDLRALQGYSGRSIIDPSLQDNVLIPNNFFEYIYHIGCAINLHSIINS